MSERLVIAGPAGDLEALVEDPGGAAPAACMVVCHPHPLHGGTMQNKVVTTLARCAEERGMPSLRFNFRGVGASAGAFDEGRGETDDALAAVATARQRWPDAALWLAGFSFGGYIALRASTTRGVGEVSRLVTIAPAFTRYFGTVRDVTVPNCPWMVVQDPADEVIDGAAVIDWCERSGYPHRRSLRCPPPGTSFTARLNDLKAAVLPFLG